MEKLSIEEKAKAYDKALDRAQALYNDKNEIGYANAESVLEEVFPLLKEPEDERIRKELIKFLQECHNIDSGFFSRYCEIPFAQTLAWLEKQGREKPADNVESKFKVGDWITDDEDEVIFHITSYDIDYGYQLETVNGTSFHYSDETIEKKYRLWTIQDAKDGDVLTNGNFPCIFKRCDDNGSLYVYCGINAHNDFSILSEDPENVWDDYSKQYFPATKEQRDTFFAKMKESGYEWLEETKELKKIEQESAKWNEEDEHRVKDTIYFLETAKKHYASTVELGACIAWLKSIKDRYAWKPSDEQIKQLGWIAKQNKDNMIGKELISLYQDLKKLREE